MSTNTFELSELTLNFDSSAEAKAELVVAGHREHFVVGLDGVGRFSPDTLVDLPPACRGEWKGVDHLEDAAQVTGVPVTGYRFHLDGTLLVGGGAL